MNRTASPAGSVVADERRQVRAQSKISGWVEKLAVNATGLYVHKGAPAMSVYSPALLAAPPLYKLTHGAKSVYARDDAHRAEREKSVLTGKGKIEVSRFKGLGEMLPAQLKETTMDPNKRILLKVMIAAEDRDETADSVERLMGTRVVARDLRGGAALVAAALGARGMTTVYDSGHIVRGYDEFEKMLQSLGADVSYEYERLASVV